MIITTTLKAILYQINYKIHSQFTFTFILMINLLLNSLDYYLTNETQGDQLLTQLKIIFNHLLLVHLYIHSAHHFHHNFLSLSSSFSSYSSYSSSLTFSSSSSSHSSQPLSYLIDYLNLLFTLYYSSIIIIIIIILHRKFMPI